MTNDSASLYAVFLREERAMSPRAIISAVIARRGLQKRALAAKVPALGKLPACAGSNLSRYLSGVRDMHGETVGAILAALGLVIACRTCRRDAVECECDETIGDGGE